MPQKKRGRANPDEPPSGSQAGAKSRHRTPPHKGERGLDKAVTLEVRSKDLSWRCEPSRN